MHERTTNCKKTIRQSDSIHLHLLTLDGAIEREEASEKIRREIMVRLTDATLNFILSLAGR